MDMDFMRIFDILIGCYGLNFFFQWYKVRFQGQKLNPQCLLSTDLTMDACRDREGLTAFLLPRMLCFGAALLLYAVISFTGLLVRMGFWFYLLFFAAIVALYLVTNRQARRRFFPRGTQ